MKKKFCIVIMLICMCLTLGIDEVRAEEDSYSLLCSYSDSSSVLSIVYNFSDTENSWQLSYKLIGTESSQNIFSKENSYTDVFGNDDTPNVYWKDKDTYFYTNMKEDNFVCPKYAAIDEESILFVPYYAVYFDDDEFTSNHDYYLPLNTDAMQAGNSIFTYIDNLLDEASLTVDIQELVSNVANGTIGEEDYDYVLDTIKQSIIDKVAEKYNLASTTTGSRGGSFGTSTDGTYSFPTFVQNYIDSLVENAKENETLLKEFSKAIETLQTLYNEEVEKSCENGDYTEDQCETLKEYGENFTADYIILTNSSFITNTGSDCNSLLGGFADDVENILTFIKYLGPILVVIFTTIDFIKSASSGSQDDMKSASQKLVKRAIAAVLLFFIPTIINLIFDLVGITSCISS